MDEWASQNMKTDELEESGEEYTHFAWMEAMPCGAYNSHCFLLGPTERKKRRKIPSLGKSESPCLSPPPHGFMNPEKRKIFCNR